MRKLWLASTIMCSAIAAVTPASAASASGTCDVPSAVAAVRHQTPGSAVTVGSNWRKFDFLGTHSPTVNSTQNADESVDILGNSDGEGAQLSCTEPFGGGGCFQATKPFPQDANSGGGAFLANDIQNMQGNDLGNWIEADIAELEIIDGGQDRIRYDDRYGTLGSGDHVHHGETNPAVVRSINQYWPNSSAPPSVRTQSASPTPVLAATAAVLAAEGPGSCPAVGSTGSDFRVANGAITGPNGPYIVRGLNIYAHSVAATNNGAAIKATFKGLNFLRYITRPLNEPQTYDPVVNHLTSLGVVVEFEDHPDGGGAEGSVYTGAQLAAESAWYAAMAAHFKTNPYVWFGTYNEPPSKGGSLSAWQRATYDAVRGTGNNNPIMLEASGSRSWNLQKALDPSYYATMKNVVWDVHIYPYQNDFNTDPMSITDNINAMIAAAQTIQSADGKVPVIIGESGPSMTEGLAPNGYATVEALINVAHKGTMGGLASFVWYANAEVGSDTPNNLTDSSGNPTNPYGRMVQRYIGTDTVPLTQCQQGLPSPGKRR